MKFIRVLIIILVLMFSCKKSNSDLLDEEFNETVIKWNDTLPHISANVNSKEKLSKKYLENTKMLLSRFSNKNWTPEHHVSFLVAKNGQIIYEKYQGFTNKKSKKLITSSTPLHIASVSKVLTATAIMILVNANRIDLDQRVNTILATFPYPEITIKNLLTHRSGMRNYAYFTEELGVWNRSKVLKNKDLLRILGEKNIKLDAPPNTKFCYCNTNYAMLALIIEKKTGLSFAAAMKRMIFDPLGMKNTFVFDIDKDKSKIAPSYKGNNIEVGIDYLDAVYGDKNIFSTPRDLLKLDKARNSKAFLTEKLRNQIYQGYSNEKKGTKNYGLGIRMINWETGQNYYFHNGWWHGNTASYITLQKENVTIISLSNKYTTMSYKVRDLAPYFGDYPFKVVDSM